MGICGVAVSQFFLCGVAVISNRTECGVFFFILKLRCSVKKYLCGVAIYFLTHLTDLPVPLWSL